MAKGNNQSQKGNFASQQWQPEVFLQQEQGLEQQRREILRRLAFLKQKEKLETHKPTEIVYDGEQRQIKAEIAAIHQEIKQLAKKVVHVHRTIDHAIEQPVVKTSRYELSFWQHIRRRLQQLVHNVDDVDLWLQEWSKRKRRKGDFWGTVSNKKRGGAQFLLSSEHSASRSAS